MWLLFLRIPSQVLLWEMLSPFLSGSRALCGYPQARAFAQEGKCSAGGITFTNIHLPSTFYLCNLCGHRKAQICHCYR